MKADFVLSPAQRVCAIAALSRIKVGVRPEPDNIFVNFRRGIALGADEQHRRIFAKPKGRALGFSCRVLS